MFVSAPDGFPIHSLAAQEFSVGRGDTARDGIIVVQSLVMCGHLRFQLAAVHLA
jgi:hypothetical protein